jgi:hypothetical protein
MPQHHQHFLVRKCGNRYYRYIQLDLNRLTDHSVFSCQAHDSAGLQHVQHTPLLISEFHEPSATMREPSTVLSSIRHLKHWGGPLFRRSIFSGSWSGEHGQINRLVIRINVTEKRIFPEGGRTKHRWRTTTGQRSCLVSVVTIRWSSISTKDFFGELVRRVCPD